MLFPVTFSRAFVLPCQCGNSAKRFRTDQSAYCCMRGTLESCSQWKEYSRLLLFRQEATIELTLYVSKMIIKNTLL